MARLVFTVAAALKAGNVFKRNKKGAEWFKVESVFGNFASTTVMCITPADDPDAPSLIDFVGNERVWVRLP